MFKVRAPNREHNGTSAGVRFTAGVGHTDNPAAVAYFRRVGYEVTLEAAVDEPASLVGESTVEPLVPEAAGVIVLSSEGPASPFAPGPVAEADPPKARPKRTRRK